MFLQASHDVKLDGVEIFRRETYEGHAYALRSLCTCDPGKYVQRSTNFRDLELQGYFLAHLCIHRGLQQHSAFADIHAAQGNLPATPVTDDFGKEGQTGRVPFAFPPGRVHSGQHRAEASRRQGLAENEVGALAESLAYVANVVRGAEHHDGGFAVSF